MSSRRFAAAILYAASTLICADNARALDAYWHGVRSDVWSDGIAGGVSNWYSQAPPDGVARNVPDGTATFAPDAMRFVITVPQSASINRMIFTTDAPLYTFRVAPGQTFSLPGAGVLNRSNNTPRFTLRKAGMSLTGDARLVGQRKPAAHITTVDGLLVFEGTSRGGDAVVVNTQTGRTEFAGRSSAEQMKITNRDDGNVIFADLATGGEAHIVNEADGFFSIENTLRANGVPIGQVDNDGAVYLGIEVLRVARNFAQGGGGKLFLAIAPAGVGSIVVAQSAAIGGTLRVRATLIREPGTHKIVRANAVTGRFRQFVFEGHRTLKARLAYSAKEVAVIIERK